jgi:hypothetical protein
VVPSIERIQACQIPIRFTSEGKSAVGAATRNAGRQHDLRILDLQHTLHREAEPAKNSNPRIHLSLGA